MAIGAEGDGQHSFRVSLKDPSDGLAGYGIPEAEGFVLRTRNEATTIGAEGDGVD